MGRPIAINKGIAFAFPDVCKTPVPFLGMIPFPLVNIAQLSDADSVSDESGKELLIGPSGDHALLEGAKISSSTGDEAGVGNGVVSGTTTGEAEIVLASQTVKYNGTGIVRILDTTTQNDSNATGVVLSAFPTVLVGG